MLSFLEELPYRVVFVTALHLIGFYLLYRNRVALLFDDDDNNSMTPPTLSLGRCWSWIMFYTACSYWLRYASGSIPSTTPFPPGLQEMLFACLVYEFAKKGIDVSKIWLAGRDKSYGSSSSYSGGYNAGYSNTGYSNRDAPNAPSIKSAATKVDENYKVEDYVPAKAVADDEK